jgi:hypothetical protein
MFAPLVIAAALSSSANPPSPQRDSSHPIAAGRQRLQSSRYFLKIGQSDIEVDIQLQPSALQTDDVLQWVRRAAESVTTYYGRFPVQRVQVSVTQSEDSDESIHGTTWGDIEGFQGVSRMSLGRSISNTDLAADWTMTHEFVHMGMASLADEHHWLEEGLATYVEPIARAQDGQLTAEKVWRDVVSGMPQGEPQPATEVSTGRTPGVAPTGEAQCSAWSLMWRSGERPVTAGAYRMPFVPSLRQGLRSIPTPLCLQFFALEIRPQGQRC